MIQKNIKYLLIGLGLGICTITLHLLLNEKRGAELSSFLLVLIGSVYYGFALLGHNRNAVVIEAVVATLFVLMAIFGLWISPWILIAGLFLHGLWDIAHHNKTFKLVKIPEWYIPFCAIYDWTIALYLTFLILN